MKSFLAFTLLISLLLVGCGKSDEPEKVVERYLSAKVSGNKNTIRNLLCKEMEDNFEVELFSFASAKGAKIVDMECSNQEGSQLIACTGDIITRHDGEVNEYPLSLYRVVSEEGEWKWCGEAP